MRKAFIIAAAIIVAFAALTGCSSKNTSSESQSIQESNAEKVVETTVAVSTETVEKTSNVLTTESTTYPVDSSDDVIQPITAGSTYGKSEETRDWQAEWEEKLRKEGINPPTMPATAHSQY